MPATCSRLETHRTRFAPGKLTSPAALRTQAYPPHKALAVRSEMPPQMQASVAYRPAGWRRTGPPCGRPLHAAAAAAGAGARAVGAFALPTQAASWTWTRSYRSSQATAQRPRPATAERRGCRAQHEAPTERRYQQHRGVVLRSSWRWPEPWGDQTAASTTAPRPRSGSAGSQAPRLHASPCRHPSVQRLYFLRTH